MVRLWARAAFFPRNDPLGAASTVGRAEAPITAAEEAAFIAEFERIEAESDEVEAILSSLFLPHPKQRARSR
jgi:hypothetical protein